MKELAMKDVELIIKTMADVAIANKQYFSQLDSVVGDADFGVSLSTGFQAVLDKWGSLDYSSISSLLMKVGVVIVISPPLPSGALVSNRVSSSNAMSRPDSSTTLPPWAFVPATFALIVDPRASIS